MTHPDHVALLRPGIPSTGGVWADLGSGSGAFTLALRDILGAKGEIYSVDQDNGRLKEQERAFRQMFPASSIHYLRADFSRSLDLPPLDGIVMANALHYFRDKLPILNHVREMLKPNGVFLLVEYNVDRGNMWVPHPLTFETYRALAPRAGLSEPRLLATAPSNFLREFYSASAQRPA